MKYFVAVLLSVALIWTTQQNTPIKKSFADRASVPRTTVAVKPSTPKDVAQVQSVKTITVPAPAVVPTPAPVVVTPPSYGTHEELMAAARISPTDYGAVDYIVSHESSWNVNATEPNTGAHGLIQALPYSKTGCGWSDGVCQLEWGTQYAVSRYGSWWGAYTFWSVNHWW